MENYSYDNKNTIDEQGINIYLTLFDNTMLLDKDSADTLFNILNRMYFNHLFVLFLMSSMATLYVCSSARKNKGYIMINNVEPKLLKGEIVCKV